MRYTDKHGIRYNNIEKAGVSHASGPIGLNGRYDITGDLITNIDENLSLVNAIDINWNGAKVEPDVELNTTGDLLTWIKTKISDNSNEGYPVSIPIYAYRWYQKSVTPVTPTDTTKDEPQATDNGYPEGKWSNTYTVKPTEGEWTLWMTSSIKRMNSEGAATRDPWTTPICIDAVSNGGSDVDIPIDIKAYRLYQEGVTPIIPTDRSNEQPQATDHRNDNKAYLATRWTKQQMPAPGKENEDDEDIIWHIWSIDSVKHIHNGGGFTIDAWTNLTDLGIAKTAGQMGGELPEELERQVEDAIQTVENIERWLEDLHDDNRESVKEAIKDMFDDWDWFEAKMREGGFDFGQVFPVDDTTLNGKVGRIIQGLGYLKDDDQGITYTKLKQFINGDSNTVGTLAQLQAMVSDLAVGELSDDTIQAIAASLDLQIQQDVDGLETAVGELQAMWGITDEDKNLLAYVKSAFRAAANRYGSSADMFADMETAAGQKATSAIEAKVGIDSNGNPTAEGKLAAAINQGVQNAISGSAGIAYKADVESAFAEMFASTNDPNNNNNKHNKLMAAVRTSIDNNEKGIRTAIASLVATPTTESLKNALAGVFVECDSTGTNSLVNIIARDDNGIGAKIAAAVNNNKSSLHLTSDDITFTAGDLQAIADKVEIDASKLNITADDVTVTGNVKLSGKLSALESAINSMSVNKLHSYSGSLVDPQGNPYNANSKGYHINIENGAINGYNINNSNARNDMYSFSNDGSGFIANGNISWDANGNITINSRNVNAGSKYNTFEIYKWIIKPTGFVPNENEGYSQNGIRGHFNYELLLSYRIIKNGFIVKDDTIISNNIIDRPQISTNNIIQGGPYKDEYGLTGCYAPTGECSSTKYIIYGAYNNKYTGVNNQGAITFIKNIKTKYNNLFNQIFKDSKGEYIFSNNDIIYISFPDNIYKYYPTMQAYDQIEGMDYNTDSNGHVQTFNYWGLDYGGQRVILWANTTYQDSPYLYEIIIKMLSDLVGSSLATDIYDDLFYYNDNVEETIKIMLGLSNNNNFDPVNNIIALNKNVMELYRIWQHRNIRTGGVTDVPGYGGTTYFEQEEVDMWNQYKNQYIQALQSNNYSKGELVTLSADFIMKLMGTGNRDPYYAYEDHIDEWIGSELYIEYMKQRQADGKHWGDTLTKSVESVIYQDDVIQINWSEVMS